MSAATSPGTGLAYGLRRVCAAWGMARSSILRHDLASREQPRQSVGDRPDPDQAVVAMRPTGIALGGRTGLLLGRRPGSRKRVGRLSPHRAAAVAAI